MEKVAIKIQNFKDLKAWQEGHVAVLMIYKQSKLFPESERFGLTNQIRRAAVSITSNIAEGFSRRGSKDKSHFYTIAHGSVTECQSQLLIARDLGYLSAAEYDRVEEQMITVHKLLTGLIKSIGA